MMTELIFFWVSHKLLHNDTYKNTDSYTLTHRK